MSTIRLLIVKGNTLYCQECPWRTAIKFFDSNTKTQHRFLRLIRDKHYLDAGYILVDYDNNILVTNHSTFRIADLNPRVKQELQAWMVIEQLL